MLAINDAHIARPIRELISSGVADGDFDVPDAADAANAILGACLFTVLERGSQAHEPTATDLPDTLADQLVRGLSAA